MRPSLIITDIGADCVFEDVPEPEEFRSELEPPPPPHATKTCRESCKQCDLHCAPHIVILHSLNL